MLLEFIAGIFKSFIISTVIGIPVLIIVYYVMKQYKGITKDQWKSIDGFPCSKDPNFRMNEKGIEDHNKKYNLF